MPAFATPDVPLDAFISTAGEEEVAPNEVALVLEVGVLLVVDVLLAVDILPAVDDVELELVVDAPRTAAKTTTSLVPQQLEDVPQHQSVEVEVPSQGVI